MIMNWQDFIDRLISDFRLSESELAEKVGVTQPAINKLRNKIGSKPYQNTIRRIEESLNIKIDDRDQNNITYKKQPLENEAERVDLPLNYYPVISQVFAGGSPMLFVSDNISEYISFPYEKKENCFVVKVHGDSMTHAVNEGDYVLVDMDKEIINGCVVVVRLTSGKQLIKRYKKVSDTAVMFYSDNGIYEPVVVSNAEIEAVYRIVGIWKPI